MSAINYYYNILALLLKKGAGCPDWTDSIFKRKGTPSYTFGELWTAYMGGHKDKIPTAEQASEWIKTRSGRPRT